MFHFEQPYLLLLLFVLPLMFVLSRWYKRQQAASIEALGGVRALYNLIPGYYPNHYNKKLRLQLMLLTLLVIAWANPRKGLRTQSAEVDTADIYIALDVSESMRARDILPDRMERAKQLAYKLIDKFEGNRVGLIFFAGQSFLQMPLTSDSEAAKLFVQGASPDFDIQQGTAIESIIDLLLKVEQHQTEKSVKNLLVITDGENHNKDVIQKASAGLESGIITYILGVGTTKGAAIPIQENGAIVYKKDANGQQVISKMDMTVLNNIALAGGGRFYDAKNNTDALANALLASIASSKKTVFIQPDYDEYESYYQWFLAPALIIICLLFFHRESNN